MKIFATTEFHERFLKPLSRVDPKIEIGEAKAERYKNGELHVLIASNVSDENCIIVGSAAPPDEQLIRLCMFANALKNSGAKTVCAFLPYLGYGRQDKPKPNEAHGVELIGAMLKLAGIDKIVTFDVHSKLDESLIGLPLVSLSSAQIFVDEIKEFGWDEFVVVAPDEGAIERAKSFAGLMSAPVVHFVKKRFDGVSQLELVGNALPRAVIVDDIIDTGSTLVSACDALRAKGVSEILVVATHGLFSSKIWEQAFVTGVVKIVTSDSTPQAVAQRHEQVKITSLAPVVSGVIKEVGRL
ncbi:MAG TPA: ribose-phosphate diphosphokinase [Candidatus Saccharimonadales bacterium]|nr:ribose-phosphate diphosphokinase [Candidatus Saccharimonadales bacterium]